MTATIVNPCGKAEVGWTWDEHRAAGYQGGTDYVIASGVTLTAAATGEALQLSSSEFAVRLDNGDYITLREMKSGVGSFPRAISIGQALAVTGHNNKWPHIDYTTKAGVRSQFEPHITTSTEGGGTTPVPEEDEEVKIYEDFGANPSVANATGKFFAAAPGRWVALNHADFGGEANVRAVLTAAFGAPVQMLTSDLNNIANLYLKMAPPAAPTTVTPPAPPTTFTGTFTAKGN